MSAGTAKFRDYVTSGAFKLSLSRSQVSALAMVAETGAIDFGSHTLSALHNKGMVTSIRAANGSAEFRLTEAGVFALKLLSMAELTQGAPDPVAEELAALRLELDQARRHAQQCAADAWDMKARVEFAERKVAEAIAHVEAAPPPPKPIITLKNKHPDRTQAQIIESLNAAQSFLEGGT
jgi:hypothetical protein